MFNDNFFNFGQIWVIFFFWTDFDIFIFNFFSRCLRSDIEYKTLIVNNQTTCRDLIWMLLSKYRMRHRDPKLFYLTMDIYIKRTGIPLKRTLTLEDEARPAELKSCHPWGECKFTLQMRKGTVALKSV